VKISLAPIPYFWPRDQVHAFYGRALEWPVDIVYLGEVVCSKRRELTLDDWLHIAETLAGRGKEVVLSSLALIEAESELAVLRRIVENGRYPVEANDMAAVQLLFGRGAFVIGPHINVYNEHTLALLAQRGACRWVIPVELGREQVRILSERRPAGLEIELFAYGRLPLAFSSRCFSARAHNRPKDDCGLICGEFPEGMPLRTREGRPFLVLNGVQVQSAAVNNLIAHVPEFAACGVDIVRISPRIEGTGEVLAAFREALSGRAPADSPSIRDEPGALCCDGYWQGRAGKSWESGRNGGWT